MGRRQCNKQGHASAKGNAVASLAKGGKVVRKGDLATKKDYDKTALWWTRKICQDCKISKMARLPRGPTCQDGNVAKNGNFAQEGTSAKKGNVAAMGEFAKDSNEMKKATDNATYYNALQVVSRLGRHHHYKGGNACATKATAPSQQGQRTAGRNAHAAWQQHQRDRQ